MSQAAIDLQKDNTLIFAIFRHCAAKLWFPIIFLSMVMKGEVECASSVLGKEVLLF